MLHSGTRRALVGALRSIPRGPLSVTLVLRGPDGAHSPLGVAGSAAVRRGLTTYQAADVHRRSYSREQGWKWQLSSVLAGCTFFGVARVLCETNKDDDDDDDDDDGLRPEDRKVAPAPGGGQCHLPSYTKADVAKHATPEARIWVTYKDGVYDITEFVEAHPGGASKIMLAAGKAIDPYWNLFQQHFRT